MTRAADSKHLLPSVSTADSLNQTFKPTPKWKKKQPTSCEKFHSPHNAKSQCLCWTHCTAANEHLSPFCTSCSLFTLIVAVSRMLMVPPTDCVSTMILLPTRCSLIVNRTAAAAVNSLFSENSEVLDRGGWSQTADWWWCSGMSSKEDLRCHDTITHERANFLLYSVGH